MKYPEFCVLAIQHSKEFKEFINVLKEISREPRGGDCYGEYYGRNGESFNVEYIQFGKLVSPEEGIRILLGKNLSYDL